jgi:hypothetical protein
MTEPYVPELPAVEFVVVLVAVLVLVAGARDCAEFSKNEI